MDGLKRRGHDLSRVMDDEAKLSSEAHYALPAKVFYIFTVVSHRPRVTNIVSLCRFSR